MFHGAWSISKCVSHCTWNTLCVFCFVLSLLSFSGFYGIPQLKASLWETQASQGGSSYSGWKSVPWEWFIPDQLWPCGGLSLGLCFLLILISWKDDMPGVFQDIVILPSLQLNERPRSIHWLLLEFTTQCAFAISADIHRCILLGFQGLRGWWKS